MAIESPEYEATRAALMADPIIVTMADELRAYPPDGGLDGWSFTNAALREYNRRGGTIDTHIGGPAEAIRRLLAEK